MLTAHAEEQADKLPNANEIIRRSARAAERFTQGRVAVAVEILKQQVVTDKETTYRNGDVIWAIIDDGVVKTILPRRRTQGLDGLKVSHLYKYLNA